MSNFKKYPNISFKSTDEILSVQEELLRKHLSYCYHNSPYYSKILKGLISSNFTLDDLKTLPFTDKTDFVKNNSEFLAVERKEITDLVFSSGTTGKPAKIMYTESDLERLAYNEKMAFTGCELSNLDTVLLTCTIDRCFVAGLAYFMGVRAIGATAVRNGLNSLESHIEIIKSIQPSAIIGVPSFLYRLGKYIEELGDMKLFKSVRKLICIGEPIRNADYSFSELGNNIQILWNSDLYSTYASSEIVSTFCECREGNGGHLLPDLAIIEIINENGDLLPDNEIGEIVVTPLQCTGMPLIRFKTGDVGFVDCSKCGCGRKTLRLGPIQGRKKQMLKVQGTSLYPQAFYSILDGIFNIDSYYIEVNEKNTLSDSIKVFVSLKNPDKILVTMIENEIKAKLRISIPVIIKRDDEVKLKVFSPESRKPKKFFDNRQNNYGIV